VSAVSSAPVDVEPELDRLYGLPPGEFTAARDELAGRLRAEGERERAEEVKKLRRPTAAVWLVNRLARERELDVQRLAKAGQALGKGQSGRSADDFAAARDEEQRALERLHGAVRELAEREGIGAPSVERATQTLRAASLTDEGRRLLKQARLTEELQPPGFEALTGLPGPAPRKPAKKAKPDARAGRKAALAEARETVRGLKAQERDLRSAARSAARDADRAEAEAARLRDQESAAQAAAEEAAEQLSRAEAELEKLR
jgi:hypothetical protein